MGWWLKSCIITAWQLRHALTLWEHTHTHTLTHFYITSQHITPSIWRVFHILLHYSRLYPCCVWAHSYTARLYRSILLSRLRVFVCVSNPIRITSQSPESTLLQLVTPRTNRKCNWEVYSAAGYMIKAGEMTAPWLWLQIRYKRLILHPGDVALISSSGGGSIQMLYVSKSNNTTMWKHSITSNSPALNVLLY